MEKINIKLVRLFVIVVREREEKQTFFIKIRRLISALIDDQLIQTKNDEKHKNLYLMHILLKNQIGKMSFLQNLKWNFLNFYYLQKVGIFCGFLDQ